MCVARQQVTTDTATDATAVWDIINLSEVAQPVALHNTEFEVGGWWG